MDKIELKKYRSGINEFASTYINGQLIDGTTTIITGPEDMDRAFARYIQAKKAYLDIKNKPVETILISEEI